MKITFYALISAFIIASASAASAGVGYIKGADVDEGELDLEYELVTSFDDDKAKDNKRSHTLEGYYTA